jgi:branched-chain amino acid transport system substrate-binding protein
LFTIASGAIAAPFSVAHAAPEKIRIGIVGPFSGPFASTGLRFRQGIQVYLDLNGSKAGGREIELIYRDSGGGGAAQAKQVAEELIVRDKVHMLGGFYLSPEATAVASVVTETKTPTVLFVSASPANIRQSPFFIRAGDNILQAAVPPAEWAIKKGLTRAYIAVGDYATGYDVQNSFRARFQQLGGRVVGEDRIPLNTVDYAPFAERIANAKPDVIEIFIPSGPPSIAFLRALIAQGINPQTTAIIGMAEADDPDLHLFDDSVIGLYSSLYYAIDAPGKTNVRFKAALTKKSGPGVVPSYATVAAYDGMHALYHMAALQKETGFNSEVAMAGIAGASWESPRGPVQIEAATREMTQNIYVRQVQRRDGRLLNAIVETFKAVKAN